MEKLILSFNPYFLSVLIYSFLILIYYLLYDIRNIVYKLVLCLGFLEKIYSDIDMTQHRNLHNKAVRSCMNI